MITKNRKPRHRFEKGNKFGRGTKPLPKETKEARKLNAAESFKLVNTYAWMPPEQLKILLELSSESLPMYELGMLRSFQKYAKSGDISHIKFWIEHLVGKPKERLDVSGSIENPLDLSKLSIADIQKLASLGEKKE